ncbi:MAG TPA: universal stress protein [Flavobacteriaceae bacterium]|nr:universal stress protein [Flavobacteriaceae bacterium]
MKKILVPTDFSNEAENALKVAAQLARKYDSEIYLMNLLELPYDTASSDAGIKRGNEPLPESLLFMRLAHQRFQKLLNQDFLKGIKVTDTVEFREPFQGIIDGVKKYDADLIVMGSAGASGMQEFFVGSNTEKVVRNADVPVLVIKDEVPIFEVKDFVFASDFEKKGKETFKKALKVAERLGAKLHLLYINTSSKFRTSNEINKKIAEFIQDIPNDNYTTTVYNDHSIKEGILNYTKNIDAELMGIATNGRKGLAHLLNGSISEDLVNHAKKPVLTFRLPKSK